MAGYKNYLKFVIEGTQDYIAKTTACFDAIEVVDAKAEKNNRILRSIDSRGYNVSVRDTTSGNACRALGEGAYPVMSITLYYKRADDFTKELNAAVDKAKTGGLTLEHLARQLAIGLSPATYTGASNVGAPTMKKAPPAGASGQQAMLGVGLQIAEAMRLLKDLMSGARKVDNLPAGWDYELPRLLRNYLTPGVGAPSEVSFNPTKTFHCEADTAMNRRPPAIGLAHELIHALHNSSGVNLALVERNGQNIEETITTGMAPYNYEPLSDNMLRSKWPSDLGLRENYGITGSVRSATV